MKNKLVLGLGVLLVFGFVGCISSTNGGGDNRNGGDPDPAFIGGTFSKTTTQVYTEAASPFDSANCTLTDYDYTGIESSGALSNAGLSDATITAGKLDFSFAIPTVGSFPMNPGALVFNPPDVKMFFFLCLRTADNKQLYHAKAEKQFIMYIYADRDATIKGTAGNSAQYNLTLKTGWNSAYADLNGKGIVSGMPTHEYRWVLVDD